MTRPTQSGLKHLKNMAVTSLLISAFPLLAATEKKADGHRSFTTEIEEIHLGDSDYPTFRDKRMKSKDVLDMGTPDPLDMSTESDLDLGLVSSAIDDLLLIADKFAVIGKKVWKVVDQNRPVVEVGPIVGHHVLPQETLTGAIPLTVAELNQGVRHAMGQMYGWSMPKSRSYRIIYKNPFGMTVMKFVYTVRSVYGGQFMGQGRYLSSIMIEPRQLDVMWGYRVNVETELESVVNMGTVDNPIAGVVMTLKYNLKTAVIDSSNRDTFIITGDGRIEMIQ